MNTAQGRLQAIGIAKRTLSASINDRRGKIEEKRDNVRTLEEWLPAARRELMRLEADSDGEKTELDLLRSEEVELLWSMVNDLEAELTTVAIAEYGGHAAVVGHMPGDEILAVENAQGDLVKVAEQERPQECLDAGTWLDTNDATQAFELPANAVTAASGF